MLAAHKKYLISARAGRNKSTARLLARACKDQSIPLELLRACVNSENRLNGYAEVVFIQVV